MDALIVILLKTNVLYLTVFAISFIQSMKIAFMQSSVENIFLLTNKIFFVFLSTKYKWLWISLFLHNELKMQGLCQD